MPVKEYRPKLKALFTDNAIQVQSFHKSYSKIGLLKINLSIETV